MTKTEKNLEFDFHSGVFRIFFSNHKNIICLINIHGKILINNVSFKLHALNSCFNDKLE